MTRSESQLWQLEPSETALSSGMPVVSYSEIDTARQCLHKHELAYKDRWRKDTDSPALTTGTQVHSLLELHYHEISEGYDPTDLVAETLSQWHYERLIDDERFLLLQWIYEGYVEQWGLDLDWTLKGIELKFVVELPPAPATGNVYGFKGYIDLVPCDRTRRTWVVDHKTSASRGPSEKQLDLSDQFVMYSYALREMGIKTHGGLHNWINTKMNKNPSSQSLDSRFKRTRIARTDKEIDLVALDVAAWADIAWLDQTRA